MKTKTKSKLILLIIMIVLAVLLFFSGTLYSIKEKIINNFENVLNRTGLEVVKGKGSLIDEESAKDLEDSKITGEGYKFDNNNAYYSLLNDKEKKLYKQVYANIEKVKKEFKPVISVKSDKINDAIEAVFNDHPELFWVNPKYSYKFLDDGQVVQITLSYNSTSKNLEEHKKIFNENVDIVVNTAKKYDTDYAKEKYVHDLLIKRNTIDKNEKLNQSAYSAIVTNKTVCSGYSRAFQLIMTKLGITTYYIGGKTKGDHAWNIIKLDGDFYNVDLTLDDEDKVSYDYFNMPDSVFSKTHIRKGLSIYLPVCRGTKYYLKETKNKDKKQKVQKKEKVESTDEVMIDEKEITQEDIEKQLELEEKAKDK